MSSTPLAAEVTPHGVRARLNRQRSWPLLGLVSLSAALPWLAMAAMVADPSTPALAFAAIAALGVPWSGGIGWALKQGWDGQVVEIDERGVTVAGQTFRRSELGGCRVVERNDRGTHRVLILELRDPDREVEFASIDPINDVAWLARQIQEICTSPREGERLEREEVEAETVVRREADRLKQR